MRTAFINQLIEEARHDERIFLVVGDLGYGVVEPFEREFPNRFLNAGIAEQNMIGVAAGLAMIGYQVYVYSIGNFPTLRCLEQIRNDVCYHDLDVKIVAVGAGYAYGSLGATHHATEDVGIMRALPNMTVMTPSDPLEAKMLTTYAASHHGPTYLRLGKAGEKNIDSNIHDSALKNYVLGDLLPVVATGSIKCIIASGSIASALQNEIVNNSLDIDLFTCPCVKPLRKESLMSIVSCYSVIDVYEEHQVSCGLGSALLEQINQLYAQGMLESYPKITIHGIEDEFEYLVGSQNSLRVKHTLSLINKDMA